MTRARLPGRFWWCAAVLVAMAVYSSLRLDIHQNITHFLPGATFAREAHLARAISGSQLSRSMILQIDANSWEDASAAASELAAVLRADPLIEWVYEGPDEEFEDAAYELFFPRRMMFLSRLPEEEIPRLASDEGLRSAAARLKRTLAGPLGTNSSWLGADPLLAFTDHLRRLRDSQGEELEISGGRFRLVGTSSSVLLLRTRPDAFDARLQGELLARIDAGFDDLRGLHGDHLQLKRSGVNLFAVAGERSTKSDVSRIGVLGLLLTVALFSVLFRSVRYVLLLPVPLAAGFVGGLTACLLLFGAVHGMTLAIGTALIGVTVDYCLHLFVHHALRSHQADGPFVSAGRARRAILLGATTTAAGFAGFGWTSIVAMREIAVFAVAGIATAVAVTLWFLPPLIAAGEARPMALRRWQGVLRAGGLERWMRWSVVAAAVAVAGCLLGASRVSWNDDPAALLRADPQLEAEDLEVRSAISAMDPGRFVVASGSGVERAMVRNEEAYQVLREAERSGELGAFQSLHDFVWSEDLQRRNLRLLKEQPQFHRRLDLAFQEEGFRAGAFEQLKMGLNQAPAPLTPAMVSETPLRVLVDSSIVQTERESLVLTRLEGVSRPADLARRFEEMEGVDFFDQGSFLERAFRLFRFRSLLLLAFGLLVILAVVFSVYRRWRPALAASLPAPLAAATALSILGLVAGELNVMHVMGACLVISIGIDYSVFFVEGSRTGGDTSIAAVSSAAACTTTMVSFGLLSLSANPALRSLGSMVAFGCGLSLLLSPVGLRWLPAATD